MVIKSGCLPWVKFDAVAEESENEEQQPAAAAVEVTFQCELSDGLVAEWDGELIDGKMLLIKVDWAIVGLPKEAFVRVLETAEEELHCGQVVIYFKKFADNRALLMRTFAVFGFAPLAPHKTPACVDTREFIAMTYEI